MKNALQFLLIAIFLMSCSSDKDNNSIDLFNNISFNLNKGESLGDINSKNTDSFHSYVANSGLQIPLLKYIKATDYSIFIGVPYNTSVKELIQFQLSQDNKTRNSFQTDSLSYIYEQHSDSNIFYTTYSQDFNTNLIFILTTTNSKSVADSIFSYDGFLNRFNQNK